MVRWVLEEASQLYRAITTSESEVSRLRQRQETLDSAHRKCSPKRIFMQSTRRIWFAGILVLGLVWIGLSADRLGESTNGLTPAPQKGFLAPDFTLETMSGQKVTLSDLRGQVVVVNLWASWCGPCRLEMPAFKNIYEEYKGRGLVILAVNSTSQ